MEHNVGSVQLDIHPLGPVLQLELALAHIVGQVQLVPVQPQVLLVF